MQNQKLIYFVYFLLFISVMSCLIVFWRALRWVFSDAVTNDTYNDTGLMIVLAMGAVTMATFLLHFG